MRKILSFTATLVVFLTFHSSAQERVNIHNFSKMRSSYGSPSTARSESGGPNNGSDFTGYSGTGANINVVYHRVNWTVDPRNATNIITGTVVTYFKTITSGVNSISFDLNKNSFNNGSLSVTYHGSACSVSFPTTGNVNILNITLAGSPNLGNNVLDSVVINYSGVSPGVVGWAQGYQQTTVSGDKYTTSLSESYEDRDFWPCKADMQDKIDSMDINVTVPWVTATADTFWVATNGLLYDSTITGSNRTFKLKTRYPIASYLVCLSVAKFTRYHRNKVINGTNVPVVFYLLRNTGTQSTKVAAMDKITDVLGNHSDAMIYFVKDKIPSTAVTLPIKWLTEFSNWMKADGFNYVITIKD